MTLTIGSLCTGYGGLDLAVEQHGRLQHVTKVACDMTNRSKAVGTAAETAVVNYLRASGYPHVERRALSGAADKGDIAGLPVVVEVKACKTMQLAQWVDEADQEAANAGVRVGVVWHKRPRKGHPEDWYVSMSGAMFVHLLAGWYGGRR